MKTHTVLDEKSEKYLLTITQERIVHPPSVIDTKDLDAPDEREAGAELDKKPGDVLDEGALDLA